MIRQSLLSLALLASLGACAAEPPAKPAAVAAKAAAPAPANEAALRAAMKEVAPDADILVCNPGVRQVPGDFREWERDEWLRWAARSNVHPLVQRLVREQPEVFATSSPRSWAYAGDVLARLEPAELAQRELVLALARGYLPLAWANLLAESVGGLAALPPLDVARCFAAGGDRWFGDVVTALAKAGRTDAIAMHVFTLRQAAAPAGFGRAEWERLFAAVPGDLRQQALAQLVAP